MKHSLLPSGLYDLLPPLARLETATVGALLGTFASFGYEQVTPPLLEFEETLFAGRGETLGAQTFRVMDPLTQNMMGFRADMTLQVARIASTLMANAPRPLRLCYAGQVLRVKGEALRPERQTRQAGIELIGINTPESDAEVIMVAIEALSKLGIGNLSIDLNLPGLVPMLLEEDGLSAEKRQEVEIAVAQKDTATIASQNFKHKDTLVGLMQAAGEAKAKLPELLALKLPTEARQYLAHLEAVVSLLNTNTKNVTLTVDMAEFRGLEYHRGVSFSIFSSDVRGELGRGGRYHVETQPSIEATGFTLYVGQLLSVLKPLPPVQRIFLPPGTSEVEARALREIGYTTLYDLQGAKDVAEEARRLHCTHLYRKGNVETL